MIERRLGSDGLTNGFFGFVDYNTHYFNTQSPYCAILAKHIINVML
jgi:hypothetical protein